MHNEYSIAEARDNLAEIVHEAESGHAVSITRRGRPVAVLLSSAEFERLTGRQSTDLWTAIMEFRAAHDLASVAAADFADLRDTSGGRDFSWEV